MQWPWPYVNPSFARSPTLVYNSPVAISTLFLKWKNTGRNALSWSTWNTSKFHLICQYLPLHFNMAHSWVGGPYTHTRWMDKHHGIITSTFFHPYLLMHGLHLACVVGRLLWCWGPVASQLESYKVSTCTLRLRELQLFGMSLPDWL